MPAKKARSLPELEYLEPQPEPSGELPAQTMAVSAHRLQMNPYLSRGPNPVASQRADEVTVG